MGDYKEEILPLRNEIDRIDNELLTLFKERFEVVEKVWFLKEKHGIQPLDMNRWNNILEGKIKKGEDLWLNPEFIKNVWKNIHKNALKIEKK